MAELNARNDSFIALLLDISGRARPSDLSGMSAPEATGLLQAYQAAHPELMLSFEGETLVNRPVAQQPVAQTYGAPIPVEPAPVPSPPVPMPDLMAPVIPGGVPMPPAEEIPEWMREDNVVPASAPEYGAPANPEYGVPAAPAGDFSYDDSVAPASYDASADFAAQSAPSQPGADFDSTPPADAPTGGLPDSSDYEFLPPEQQVVSDKPKTSKRLLIIIGIGVAVLLIAGGLAYAVMSGLLFGGEKPDALLPETPPASAPASGTATGKKSATDTPASVPAEEESATSN